MDRRDASQRADWLTSSGKKLAVIGARRAFPDIVDKMVDKASRGSLTAAQFLRELALGDDQSPKREIR